MVKSSILKVTKVRPLVERLENAARRQRVRHRCDTTHINMLSDASNHGDSSIIQSCK